MTERPDLHRLLPAPAQPITIEAAYARERRPHTDRPWIGLCMVTSLDGTIAVDGRSSGLGNRNDLDVLMTLRRLSDMVIVGAGTVRDEGYGTPRDPSKRIGVVTNSGRVDLDVELFTSGAGFLITSEAAAVDESRVDVLRAGAEEVDLPLAVTRLTEIDPDVRWVQAEGGAALNGSLLDADLIDEVAFTWSPNLAGGDGPRITSGAGEQLHGFELAHLLVDTEHYVFTNYLRRR